MKKIIKYLLSTIILVLVLIYLLKIIYYKSVFNNLNEKEKLVENVWKDYIKNKNEKNQGFLKVMNTIKDRRSLKDSLSFYINNTFKNETKIYKSSDFKSFVTNEYYINKYSLLITDNINLKDDLKSESELISIINKCNYSIELFNSNVQEFNYFRGVFPNFFVARKYNIKSIDFFNISYGKENKNPNEKSNIDKWIETGDSKYLEKNQNQ